MKNKIFLITVLLAGLYMLNSCLKDDHDYWADGVKGKLYATVFSPGFHSQSIQPIAGYDTFSFMINIATDKLPTSDVTVNLALDNAAISAYDSTLKAKALLAHDTLDNGKANFKNYKPYPSIELLTPTIVIPKGTRTAIAKFRIFDGDTLNITFPRFFMGAVSITSVTPTSVKQTSNMNTYLLAMPIANEYEGLYSNDGFFRHPTSTSSRALTADKYLYTVDKNTCQLGLADLEDAATPAYYINVFVDKTSTVLVDGKIKYKVTITNVYPLGGPATLEQLDSSDDLITFDSGVTFNYYDPDTKSFILRYRYNNGAAWRDIEERLTKN